MIISLGLLLEVKISHKLIGGEALTSEKCSLPLFKKIHQ